MGWQDPGKLLALSGVNRTKNSLSIPPEVRCTQRNIFFNKNDYKKKNKQK